MCAIRVTDTVKAPAIIIKILLLTKELWSLLKVMKYWVELLFCRAQHLADILSSKGLPAVCISGELHLGSLLKLSKWPCCVLNRLLLYGSFLMVSKWFVMIKKKLLCHSETFTNPLFPISALLLHTFETFLNVSCLILWVWSQVNGEWHVWLQLILII